MSLVRAARTRWRPLLHGDDLARARAALDTIARELAALRPSTDPSLATGTAGLAVFNAYYARATGDDASRALGLRQLEASARAVIERPLGQGLHSGFCGVAWAVEHLRRDYGDRFSELNDSIDSALTDALARERYRGPFDLIEGLVGWGVYALERGSTKSARRCLAEILGTLTRTAERSKDAATWFSPPRFFPAQQRAVAPHGYYNLGVAHGIGGVIGLLRAVTEIEGTDSEHARLLADALRWLIRQQTSDDACIFPAWMVDGKPRGDRRSAWCYGDPGIATVVVGAARVLGIGEWEDQAIGWMTSAAARSVETTGVKDCGLCHGAAGLAHMFNRVYQATGNEALGDASRRWFRTTLAMQSAAFGVAGFAAYRPGAAGAVPWVDDAGVLGGTAGIGLALLAATTSVLPAWDRCLLLDLPSSTDG